MNIQVSNDIPLSKGLGSSAATVIAGYIPNDGNGDDLFFDEIHAWLQMNYALLN